MNSAGECVCLVLHFRLYCTQETPHGDPVAT